MKLVITLCLTLLGFIANAQDIQMADAMRSEGKIYVVVAVVLIILIGLFIYLFSIDRKLKQLEEEVKNK